MNEVHHRGVNVAFKVTERHESLKHGRICTIEYPITVLDTLRPDKKQYTRTCWKPVCQSVDFGSIGSEVN